MKTKHLLTIVMVPLLLVVFLSSAPAAETSKAPGVAKIIRFAYSMPSKRSQAYGWEWLGPEFEKRTNGRYKIEYYPGETLFKIASAFDSITSNVAQISNLSIGQQEKRLALSNGMLLPTLDFPMTLKARIAAGRAFMQVYDKMPQLQAEWKGVKLFGVHILNPYVLASKRKEVSLPEHFKGYKAGGTGLRMKLVSNNGGADVASTPPEAYMNIDKGVVDGCFVSWSQIWDYKLWEAAKYYYDFSFGAGAFAMIMNMDFWNGMSSEDQKIFMELWNKAYEMGIEYNWQEIEKGTQAATAGGAKIRKPTAQEMDAWRKAAAPVINQWIAETKAAGAKDPDLVLAEWQKQLHAYKE
jgi:TRAP-type C4-dicarboxylate transport system substrate-binding protein